MKINTLYILFSICTLLTIMAILVGAFYLHGLPTPETESRNAAIQINIFNRTYDGTSLMSRPSETAAVVSIATIFSIITIVFAILLLRRKVDFATNKPFRYTLFRLLAYYTLAFTVSCILVALYFLSFILSIYILRFCCG